MDASKAVIAQPPWCPCSYEIGGGFEVAVDVVVLLFLGAVIVFLCRDGGLKEGHANECAVVGLHLAGTRDVGPFAKDVTESVPNLPSGLRP
jgi:hypothetical protein